MNEQLAQTIHKLRQARGEMTLEDILNLFGEQSTWIGIFILALPFNQPIPLPGLSTPVGFLIALLGFAVVIDKPVWIPKRFGQKKVPESTRLAICDAAEKIIPRIAKIVCKRGDKIFKRSTVHKVAGFMVIVSGLLLSLPLPIPFSNFFPGLVISFLALAFLFQDAVFLFAGCVIQVLCLIFFGLLLWAPAKLISHWRSGTHD